ncbi:MAG: glycine--tRNA ligase [Aigarchaeota archaeon]|nr:glycine--tRNA ligase [Aigarchaeota archaeon]MCX8192587.1 glycine--tRNA ligase [Nitrososphaeria archaeon]MDW7985677.1 glycine--tRNA ligase [Nitrososphaerota archaeon]
MDKIEQSTQRYEAVIRLALERGFFNPASEIYGDAPAGFWDYGPLGASLKRKFIELWRRELVRRDGMLEIDGAQVLSKNVFTASGHLKSFVDPIARCSRCRAVYRVDKLIEESVGIHVPERLDLDKIEKLVLENNIRCSKCGGELTDFSYFNMMFKLNVGATDVDAYLRPETCQSIFVDFIRLFKVMRCKLPIGFAQVGKSFRNEISPRQGLIRMREFYQAEIEVFFNPRKADELPKAEPLMDYTLRLKPLNSEEIIEIACREALGEKLLSSKLVAYYLALIQQFYEKAGIPREKIRLRQLGEDERAFYAVEAWDLEVETSLGWIELVACNNRGDYDLSGHQEVSGHEMTVQDDGEKVLPHVFELSMGIDRSIYCIIESALSNIGGRKVLRLNPELAPVHVAVLPLISREPFITRAKQIYDLLRLDYDVVYDDSGSIGRRYARQDEIGTPYCITVDHQTFEDDTVTIRYRDTTHQIRIETSKLLEFLSKNFRIS